MQTIENGRFATKIVFCSWIETKRVGAEFFQTHIEIFTGRLDATRTFALMENAILQTSCHKSVEVLQENILLLIGKCKHEKRKRKWRRGEMKYTKVEMKIVCDNARHIRLESSLGYDMVKKTKAEVNLYL